jgi:two-component system response regulator RegA
MNAMTQATAKTLPVILVVDDDQAFRTRLVRALEDRHFPVIHAEGASQALEQTRQHRPDRAIVDMRMNGISGLQLIGQLLAIHDEMDIVVLTGFGSIATAKDAIRAGAMDYLTKPATTEQILMAFEANGDGSSLAPTSAPSLAQVEWEHIQRILVDCDGNVSQAARVLGIHRRSLQRKLAKHSPSEA